MSNESKESIAVLVVKILVIESFKYLEVYNKYKSIIHTTLLKEAAKKIYKIFNDAKIYDLRNQWASHQFGKDGKQTLQEGEFNKLIRNIEKQHKSLYAFSLKYYEYDMVDNYSFLQFLIALILEIKKLKAKS